MRVPCSLFHPSLGWSLGALFGVALTVASASAIAQPAAPPPKTGAPTPTRPPAAKVDIGAALQKLKSGDEAQIRGALDELRLAQTGGAPAAATIAELLARGLSEALTLQAIDTLREIESPDGSAVLSHYATHRTVGIRRSAVKALTRTKGAPATAALRRALSDGDPQVRNDAAAGLGSLKAKDAVTDLFLALDHKVNEAAASIGQLCNAEQCDQLAAKLGKLPFDVVTTGLDQILFRGAAEVSDDTKIKVIGRLRELGTAEANRFLKDVEKRLPRETSARVKQAVEQAVKATTGGSQ